MSSGMVYVLTQVVCLQVC